MIQTRRCPTWKHTCNHSNSGCLNVQDMITWYHLSWEKSFWQMTCFIFQLSSCRSLKSWPLASSSATTSCGMTTLVPSQRVSICISGGPSKAHHSPKFQPQLDCGNDFNRENGRRWHWCDHQLIQKKSLGWTRHPLCYHSLLPLLFTCATILSGHHQPSIKESGGYRGLLFISPYHWPAKHQPSSTNEWRFNPAAFRLLVSSPAAPLPISSSTSGHPNRDD